jgi:hypothetical protein
MIFTPQYSLGTFLVLEFKAGIPMDKDDFTFLVIGLPEAGKTSFIHAIDDLLQSPTVPEALRGTGFAPDRTYLEREKGAFRGGKKLKHTERNLQDAHPELWFEDPASGRKGKLFVPDRDGEVFQDQWVDRTWSIAYKDELKSVTGLMLFLRADVAGSNQELLGAMAALPANKAKGLPWDPKKASAQVQLVDILQFIALKGKIATPLKIAVMISAWDTVQKPTNKQPKVPALFLAREWSLLDQFLRANSNIFTSRIYGVSALGGTEEELVELCKLPPQDRVQLVEGTDVSKDLTRPLRWLMAEND